MVSLPRKPSGFPFIPHTQNPFPIKIPLNLFCVYGIIYRSSAAISRNNAPSKMSQAKRARQKEPGKKREGIRKTVDKNIF